MIIVKKKKGESNDSLINRFRSKVIEHDQIREIRARERFVSKAEKRKERRKKLEFKIMLEKKNV